MIDKIRALNNQYIDSYWDIFDNNEAVPAEQQARMREELLKLYNRASAILDGQAGLNEEREIEELKYKHAEILEQSRLREEKLKKEYQLKHVELSEQTETKSARLKKEFEIKRRADAETLEIKAEQIVPVMQELPRRWWQRKPRYYKNYAYELAEQKAALEAADYLAAREGEVLRLEAEQTGTDELELSIRKVIAANTDCRKRGSKAKAIKNALEELIKPLSAMFARRERALDELNKRLLDADTESAFIEQQEPEHDEQTEQDEQSAASELDELQRKAASLLAAFCQKRIAELQQASPKPKRQRIRKTRPAEGGKQND